MKVIAFIKADKYLSITVDAIPHERSARGRELLKTITAAFNSCFKSYQNPVNVLRSNLLSS